MPIKDETFSLLILCMHQLSLMLAKFLLLVSLFSYRENLLENLGKLHVLPKNAKSPPPVNVHHSRTPLPKVWKRILGSRDGVVVRAIAFRLLHTEML